MEANRLRGSFWENCRCVNRLLNQILSLGAPREMARKENKANKTNSLILQECKRSNCHGLGGKEGKANSVRNGRKALMRLADSHEFCIQQNRYKTTDENQLLRYQIVLRVNAINKLIIYCMICIVVGQSYLQYSTRTYGTVQMRNNWSN